MGKRLDSVTVRDILERAGILVEGKRWSTLEELEAAEERLAQQMWTEAMEAVCESDPGFREELSHWAPLSSQEGQEILAGLESQEPSPE